MPSPYREKNLRLIELLVAERAKSALLQKDLAAKMGKPQSFVAKVQGGERRLDVAEFIEYANTLGISPLKIMLLLVRSKTDEP